MSERIEAHCAECGWNSRQVIEEYEIVPMYIAHITNCDFARWGYEFESEGCRE